MRQKRGSREGDWRRNMRGGTRKEEGERRDEGLCVYICVCVCACVLAGVCDVSVLARTRVPSCVQKLQSFINFEIEVGTFGEDSWPTWGLPALIFFFSNEDLVLRSKREARPKPGKVWSNAFFDHSAYIKELSIRSTVLSTWCVALHSGSPFWFLQ